MFRMFLRYWWQVIKRAFWDSITFLGFSHPSRFAIGLALFVVAVVILQAIGGDSQMGDEIRWGLATLIAALFFFGLTFIANLLFAPAIINQEYRGNITRLQDELAKHKVSKVIADGLAVSYEDLSSLLTEKVTSAKQLEDWNKRRDKWWRSTVDYICENISVSESVLFSHASITQKANEPVKFQHQYNQAHCDQLMGLGILGEKLEELIMKYDKAITQSAVDK